MKVVFKTGTLLKPEKYISDLAVMILEFYQVFFFSHLVMLKFAINLLQESGSVTLFSKSKKKYIFNLMFFDW